MTKKAQKWKSNQYAPDPRKFAKLHNASNSYDIGNGIEDVLLYLCWHAYGVNSSSKANKINECHFFYVVIF